MKAIIKLEKEGYMLAEAQMELNQTIVLTIGDRDIEISVKEV